MVAKSQAGPLTPPGDWSEVHSTMPHTKLKAVVFDFDGTLATLTIDFSLMHKRVAALAASFLDEPPESAGLPALEWVAELTTLVSQRSGQDAGLEFASRCRLMITDMEVRAARQGALFPSTLAVLGRLRELGVALAVITRNCTAAVQTVFPHIGQYVGCVLARNDVVRVKPHPDHLHAALACLGVDAGRSLMVGDHPMDVRCGQAAGALTAAVTTGNQGREALAAAQPDYLANDLPELLAQLEKNFFEGHDEKSRGLT